MNPLKVRLAAMNFIEFAVWGAYLTSLGIYLYGTPLRNEIGWFYAVQGLVSIFMPAIVGIIADRWIPAQRMLSLCHLLAGAFMMGAGFYCYGAGESVRFAPLFILYTLSVAFFMPTIGLANSVSYNAMEREGMDTVKEFPPIRVFGTVGFIAAMWVTNFTGFQSNYWQMVFSGALSIVMVVYALTMPNCPVSKGESKGLVEALGLRAFALFKDKSMAIFFIFSMLLGVSLQITNGFATTFISSFAGPDGQGLYSGNWFAENATFLTSLSQISETLCILLIPFFLKRFGIKIVMMMAMLAWFLRFGFFGIGNPGSGLVFLILSMIVYGVAFDFFNVSGSLYVDQKVDGSLRSSAQGLFMIMTNGIGATVGTLCAQAVVTDLVNSQPDYSVEQAQGWSNAWLIFAGYALIVAFLFWICFRNPRKDQAAAMTKAALKAEASKADDPGGEVLL